MEYTFSKARSNRGPGLFVPGRCAMDLWWAFHEARDELRQVHEAYLVDYHCHNEDAARHAEKPEQPLAVPLKRPGYP
jgi:hypothetical protein